MEEDKRSKMRRKNNKRKKWKSVQS